jgi:hypothetical protein
MSKDSCVENLSPSLFLSAKKKSGAVLAEIHFKSMKKSSVFYRFVVRVKGEITNYKERSAIR